MSLCKSFTIYVQVELESDYSEVFNRYQILMCRSRRYRKFQGIAYYALRVQRIQALLLTDYLECVKFCRRMVRSCRGIADGFNCISSINEYHFKRKSSLQALYLAYKKFACDTKLLLPPSIRNKSVDVIVDRILIEAYQLSERLMNFLENAGCELESVIKYLNIYYKRKYFEKSLRDFLYN